MAELSEIRVIKHTKYSGILEYGGLQARYTDIPVSGELLNDTAGNDFEPGTIYILRRSFFGDWVLGPQLRVLEGEGEPPAPSKETHG